MSFMLRVREPVTDGAEDAFGNLIETWEERNWEVRSIAPGSTREWTGRANRDLDVVVWTVYADQGDGPTFDGEVRLPGSSEWYEVEGTLSDWTLGPPRVGPGGNFPLNDPGIVVELRRASG